MIHAIVLYWSVKAKIRSKVNCSSMYSDSSRHGNSSTRPVFDSSHGICMYLCCPSEFRKASREILLGFATSEVFWNRWHGKEIGGALGFDTRFACFWVGKSALRCKLRGYWKAWCKKLRVQVRWMGKERNNNTHDDAMRGNRTRLSWFGCYF